MISIHYWNKKIVSIHYWNRESWFQAVLNKFLGGCHELKQGLAHEYPLLHSSSVQWPVARASGTVWFSALITGECTLEAVVQKRSLTSKRNASYLLHAINPKVSTMNIILLISSLLVELIWCFICQGKGNTQWCSGTTPDSAKETLLNGGRGNI